MKGSALMAGLVFAAVTAPLACAHVARKPELKTVAYVDLNRYLGKWYEIASFPQSFQKGCTATTAEYSLKEGRKGSLAATAENVRIDVLNSCRLDRLDGKPKTANGTAKVVDSVTNAKLKVTFFWPFYGDYWIIDLGADYEYAVVGAPDFDYLWILARRPTMEPALYDAIVARAKDKGFDVSRLRKTLQPSS